MSAFRPKLAARPIAAPPRAAAMTGPAPSPHVKAPRLPLVLPLFRGELERFDVRLWVRVTMRLLLAWIRRLKRIGQGRRSCCEPLSQLVSARALEAVLRRFRLPRRRAGRRRVGGLGSGRRRLG